VAWKLSHAFEPELIVGTADSLCGYGDHYYDHHLEENAVSGKIAGCPEEMGGQCQDVDLDVDLECNISSIAFCYARALCRCVGMPKPHLLTFNLGLL